MRARRQTPGGIVYHVLNRANGKRMIFETAFDFMAFEKVLAEGISRYPIRLLGYCIMSNHWHLLLWPYNDGELSLFMKWITMTHSHRWNTAHGETGFGHLYQGRFKSFPVQSNSRYLSVLRYIESNPLRAGLVGSSMFWRWSSLAIRQGVRKDGLNLADGPVALPDNWLGLVDLHPGESDLKKIERCLGRGCPFGDEAWAVQTAGQMELTSALKPRGRPKRCQTPFH
jgi:putative transposase